MNTTLEKETTCSHPGCNRPLLPGDTVYQSRGRTYGGLLLRDGLTGYCHPGPSGSMDRVLPNEHSTLQSTSPFEYTDPRKPVTKPVVETEGESVGTSSDMPTIPQSVEEDYRHVLNSRGKGAYTQVVVEILDRIDDISNRLNDFGDRLDQLIACLPKDTFK